MRRCVVRTEVDRGAGVGRASGQLMSVTRARLGTPERDHEGTGRREGAGPMGPEAAAASMIAAAAAAVVSSRTARHRNGGAGGSAGAPQLRATAAPPSRQSLRSVPKRNPAGGGDAHAAAAVTTVPLNLAATERNLRCTCGLGEHQRRGGGLVRSWRGISFVACQSHRALLSATQRGRAPVCRKLTCVRGLPGARRRAPRSPRVHERTAGDLR
eukprot:366445-Chlamydomonas_euryale.AAC.7